MLLVKFVALIYDGETDSFRTLEDPIPDEESIYFEDHLEPRYELGEDILPKGFQDIRAKINNKPDKVFAWFDPETNTNEYFGLNYVASKG